MAETSIRPLFAGVNWKLQNVMLEDVDRIEVIRGPGSTIWGTNAVNGVIARFEAKCYCFMQLIGQ